MTDPRVVKIITGLKVREEIMYARTHVEFIRFGHNVRRVVQEGKDEFVDMVCETFIAPITHTS